MSKIAHYLQEHLIGEVSQNPEVRQHLSTDASILQMVPAFIIYPRDEQDIRKTLRFSWQLAERGRSLPITVRGGGSDTSGAAIGNGAIIMTQTHLNKILALEVKKHTVTVEPGVVYDRLQQALYTHDLFLPPCPASSSYSTIGGGIAKNIIGEKSIKYGDTAKYVKSLRVVLSNGEVIETGLLNKKELSHKMGLSSFEGQIYRALDAVIEENSELIQKFAYASEAKHNAISYPIYNIKKKNGFDLTPLFLGSQGSLGIITEATLGLVERSQLTYLSIISFSSLDALGTVFEDILELGPSICDIISREALEEVAKINPMQLKNMVAAHNADYHLLVEFDDAKTADRKQKIKKLNKIVDQVGADLLGSESYEDKVSFRKIRESINTLHMPSQGTKIAVPVAEDVAVSPKKLVSFLKDLKSLFAQNHLPMSVWGYAGSGVIKIYPMLDLNQVGDRQKLFKLSESIYNLVAGMDGSISASAGDGRARAPYTRQLYGEDLFKLTNQIKAVFDPYNILNPGVKTSSIEDVKSLMRSSYSLSHRHEHLPRS